MTWPKWVLIALLAAGITWWALGIPDRAARRQGWTPIAPVPPSEWDTITDLDDDLEVVWLLPAKEADRG